MKKIFCIMGPLGIGKSHFVKELRKKVPNAIYLSEPVDQWLQIKDEVTGENILNRHYRDPQRWAYCFENIAYVTRSEQILTALESDQSDTIIIDGALAMDKNVYAQMLHDDGKIDSLEWAAYNLWHDFYDKKIRKYPIYYIYFSCQPETIMQRIHCRERPEEMTLKIDFLTRLQQYFNKWLLDNQSYHIVKYDLSCDKDSESYHVILEDVAKLVCGGTPPISPQSQSSI